MKTPSARLGMAVLLGAWVGLSTACTPFEPDTGTLDVVGSCSRAGTIDVSVDGRPMGKVGGTASGDFTVSAGVHTVEARSSRYIWSPRTVTVPKGESFTLMLFCI